VAIDGKTAGNIKPSHTVSAQTVESSLIPGQMCMDEKTNGIKTIPGL